LTRIQHGRGTSWVAHAYAYDENYRITNYQNLIPTGNWDAPVTYTYDDTNQLLSDTTASSHYSNTYEYNLAGNRTEKDGEAQTIVAGNRVTYDGTYTYAYDEEGNIVKRTDPDGNERQLTYDYRNRLTEVKDYTGTIAGGTLKQHVKYEYDTFNRRVARWADTNGNGASNREEYYIYDGDDVVLDFVDANGATGGVNPVLKTRYLHGPAVDQILAQEELNGSGDSADVLWMLTDHLGSVRDIVNQAGEAVSHVTYDAFGNIVGGTGVLLTRYLWTGRELDTLTGLQYNRNRWYDPALGRWISEDPIGFAGGDANLYRYTWNDSVQFVDPSGNAGMVPQDWFDDTGNYIGPPKPPFHEYVPDWIEELFLQPDPSDFVHPIGAASRLVTRPVTKLACKAAGTEAAETATKKVVSRVWPAHHPFPKYLGGAIDQTLTKIPRKLHERLHSALDKWAGGKYARRKGADYFKDMNRDEVISDLRDFYESAEGGIFKKYLPDFERAVRESCP